MTYKTVLVAVDATDEAEDVVRAARGVAADRNSTISAVTVIRPMADFYGNLYSTLEDSADTAIDSVWKMLRKRYGYSAFIAKVLLTI
jgi:nucleotide-binding universal stress UspA family protein